MAQRKIYLMAAGDRHQNWPVGAVSLVGAVDRDAQFGANTDHRRAQHPADISLGDQILEVI